MTMMILFRSVLTDSSFQPNWERGQRSAHFLDENTETANPHLPLCPGSHRWGTLPGFTPTVALGVSAPKGSRGIDGRCDYESQ